ncbi:MAG: efflux RND transporter periplasmic adaptor subunit [Acidobacteriota bacterium]|nr:efflux RND transporter periplasmic adaptor subunit [Acidobacteriota bacterium]
MKTLKIGKFEIPRKTMAAILGIIVLGFLGWRVLRAVFPSGQGPGGGPGSVAVAVEIGPVRISSLRDMGLFSGTLISKSHVVVAPKISGKLNRLLVDIGDPVTSGQLVAVLEDEEYQQQVIQAEADLRVARANLEEAASSLDMSAKDLERARTLHQKGIQSDSQLDAVIAQNGAQQARYNVAVAQLANREAALQTARVRLSYTRIAALWETGGAVRYVGERFVDQGALLSANAPILSIVELHPITAVIHVTDREYFRLRIDQPAAVLSSAFPEKSFNGRVVRVAPLLKETSRQARVEIEIDNPEKLLKPGMFINAQIEFDRRENVTVVPFNAVATRDGQAGVFLIDLENTRARFQPVQTGIVEGNLVEIVEPASISGYVVTLGHYLLEREGGVILPPGAPVSGNGEGGKMPAKPDGKTDSSQGGRL